MAPAADQKNSYDEPLEAKRDVTALVTNVSPKDSPFFSMIGTTTATNRKKESITDTLAAANKDNALVEGDDFVNEALSNRAFEDNVTQIFKKVIDVSETQEAVDKYGGINSELTYQTTKAMKEIATDIEDAYINGTKAVGNATTARKLGGLITQTTTNTVTVSDAGDPGVWTGTTDANLDAFEEELNNLFETGFDTGETFDTVLVGGDRKRRISKLTLRVTRNTDADQKRQTLVVDVYDSDFGEMKIVLDRYVPDAQVLAVSRSMYMTAFLRRITQQRLAKTSDGTRFAIVGELTLHIMTEKAGGKMSQVA